MKATKKVTLILEFSPEEVPLLYHLWSKVVTSNLEPELFQRELDLYREVSAEIINL